MVILLLIVPFAILHHKGDFDNCRRGVNFKSLEISEKALPYCELWAKQGNVQAQLILGFSKYGIESNAKEQYYWLNQVVNKLQESSLQAGIYGMLGTLNLNGQGTPQNYDLAFSYFLHAAQLGSSDGQYNLSIMYADGTGAKKNKSMANWWLVKSALNGNSRARNLIRKRELKVINHDTNQTLYFDDLFTKANQGESIEQSIVATMLFSGIYFPKNNEMAYDYALKSAQQNNTQAQLILSELYKQHGWAKYSESQSQYWLNRYKHNDPKMLLKIKVN